jgi:GT2 family glycosyltransferase
MDEVEVIVVCNGSDKESADLVVQAGPSVKLFWTAEPLGFTKAANIGFKLAMAEFIVTLNTDAHILDYCERDEWLNRLLAPFENPKVGVTGLGLMKTRFGLYAPFYCTGIRRSLFDIIGYLDERFSPGYHEDADFCYGAAAAGFELVQVDSPMPTADRRSTITDFPIWHQGEQSFMDKEKRKLYNDRGYALLEKKWGVQ